MKHLKVLAIAVIIMALFTCGMSPAFAEWGIPGDGQDKRGFIGEDGLSMRIGHINTMVYEGETSDAFETTVRAVDPTADNTILYPDESGTVLTNTGAATSLSLADTKILIGGSDGLAAPQTIGTGHSLTNSGALTHIANTVSSTDILNGTIAATDVAANAFGTASINVNTVSVTVAGSGTSGTATVTAGSTILGAYPFANVNDSTKELINSVSISSTTLTVRTIGTVGALATIYKVVILEP